MLTLITIKIKTNLHIGSRRGLEKQTPALQYTFAHTYDVLVSDKVGRREPETISPQEYQQHQY